VSLHSSRSADFMGVFTVVDFKECITVCIPITRLPCGFVMFLQAWRVLAMIFVRSIPVAEPPRMLAGVLRAPVVVISEGLFRCQISSRLIFVYRSSYIYWVRLLPNVDSASSECVSSSSKLCSFKLGVSSVCTRSAMSSFSMGTRSVGCVSPVFVMLDEVGLGSSLFPSACAVLFICVDLAWDAVMRFVCFLCGIRFSEH